MTDYLKGMFAGIVLILLFLAVDILADGYQLDYQVRGARAPYRITMCDGQDVTKTGPCDDVGDNSGNIIAHRFNGAYTITIYGTQSTATAYTCDLYSNDTGYDVDAADKQKVNVTSLTESDQVISFAGMFDYAWMECTTITGGEVTVTLLASGL
jgi:hypothetical protein